MHRASDDQHHRLNKLTDQVEHDLHGLTVAQTAELVSRHPGLSLLAVDQHEPIPAIYRPGEVIAYVDSDSGLIVDPDTIEEIDD